MSRRRRAPKRKLVADPRYNNVLVSQLINLVMERGKKLLAQSIVYGSFQYASEQVGKGDPVDILLGALENARPKLEVKSRRVGGATYQVPVEITYERQVALAFRWMVNTARSRKGTMASCLGAIIVDAYNNTGDVIRKKEEVHKMAQANKAFAHLRWGAN